MWMFCGSLFVPLYFFFLAIMLSVLLLYTNSYYLPLVSSSGIRRVNLVTNPVISHE
jgi:hypothetical protein